MKSLSHSSEIIIGELTSKLSARYPSTKWNQVIAKSLDGACDENSLLLMLLRIIYDNRSESLSNDHKYSDLESSTSRKGKRMGSDIQDSVSMQQVTIGNTSSMTNQTVIDGSNSFEQLKNESTIIPRNSFCDHSLNSTSIHTKTLDGNSSIVFSEVNHRRLWELAWSGNVPLHIILTNSGTNSVRQCGFAWLYVMECDNSNSTRSYSSSLCAFLNPEVEKQLLVKSWTHFYMVMMFPFIFLFPESSLNSLCAGAIYLLGSTQLPSDGTCDSVDFAVYHIETCVPLTPYSSQLYNFKLRFENEIEEWHKALNESIVPYSEEFIKMSSKERLLYTMEQQQLSLFKEYKEILNYDPLYILKNNEAWSPSFSLYFTPSREQGKSDHDSSSFSSKFPTPQKLIS